MRQPRVHDGVLTQSQLEQGRRKRTVRAKGRVGRSAKSWQRKLQLTRKRNGTERSALLETMFMSQCP